MDVRAADTEGGMGGGKRGGGGASRIYASVFICTLSKKALDVDDAYQDLDSGGYR